MLAAVNEMPLQDAAHALVLQKTVRDSIFLHEFSTKQGWYQARVHPFGSGNGKGDTVVWCHGEVKKCKS